MADPKPSDERSPLLKLLAQQDEARTKTLEHLAALDGNPRRIDKKDQGAINENMESIRDGRAIVVDLQQPKPGELKPHEISRRVRLG